nr:[FeFe] hydrogenase H-cluster radical SAM maturase HydE [Hathewaya proteolytica]
MKELVSKLEQKGILSPGEFETLINESSTDDREFLYERAREKAKVYYGNSIYIRGLIELTNYCKNNCYYCGIRRDNKNLSRYRLEKEDILNCCHSGYELGFRTFVLQGGEDAYYTKQLLVDIISEIRNVYPQCAVTLSLGERTCEDYKAFFQAGASRYLLRHETANEEHYRKLHPNSMSLEHRKECLWNLKSIGYQVGTGFMVGSPYQNVHHIISDLEFLYQLKPEMVGIGPFIPHHETPFSDFKAGTMEQTTVLIAIIRLMFPNALIPSTTSLATVSPQGRLKGILAGANVVMPNLSPWQVRKKYMLYDNKKCTEEEGAEGYKDLAEAIKSIGYKIVVHRGDYKPI